jgi:hypothetical protein
MTDPLLNSSSRFSAWTATLASVGDNTEAKVQANLCDVPGVGKKCDEAKLGFDLAAAGPVSKASSFTELADLNGLVGSNRIEAGFRSNILDAGAASSFSLRGSFADPSFDYRVGPGLEKVSKRHPLYSGTAGVSIKTVKWFAGGAYRYENTYKAADAQSVCAPAGLGSSGTLICESLVLAAPSHTAKSVVSGEVRRAFASAAVVASNLSYDTTRRIWGVDVPVWIIPRDSVTFGSGVRLGYRSDTRRATAAFFVSTFKW